jgi:hypothetical protein
MAVSFAVGCKSRQRKCRESQRRLHGEQHRSGTQARQLERMRKHQRNALLKHGGLDLDPPRYELKAVALEEALKATNEDRQQSPDMKGNRRSSCRHKTNICAHADKQGFTASSHILPPGPAFPRRPESTIPPPVATPRGSATARSVSKQTLSG